MGLIDRIALHAAHRGDAISVDDGSQTASYAELIARARMLCARLQALDRTRPAGVLIPPSVDYVVAILALLMSGHVMVPLNDRHPQARLKQIAARAGLGALIALDADAATALGVELVRIPAAPAPVAPADVGPALAPERIVMISFTSGSTGEPKGVSRTEASVIERLRSFVPSRPLTADDRVPLLDSPSVGTSVNLALNILGAGGRLGLFEMSRLGLSTTIQRLQRFHPTAYNLVGSSFKTLFGAADALPRELVDAVRWVRLGGDPVQHADVALYRRRFPETCRLFAAIGSNETGAFATLEIDHRTRLDRPLIPVGKAAPEVLVEILNNDGVPVMPGEIGEIHVTGPGVAEGYWRDPGLTARRFAPSPRRPGQNRFSTGDFGRVLPDGMIECVGRRDRQLKIRGVTVHPAEIEAVLGSCPQVSEAAVIAASDSEGRPVLIGCYVGSADPDSVRGWVRAHLEGAMRPARLLQLAAMPVLPGGKLDHEALGALAAEPERQSAEAPAAASPYEEIVRRAWTAWLLQSTYADDLSFEAAGGDSLLGLKLVLSLETLLERALPFGLLDPETRPSDLVRHLAGLDGAAATDDDRPLLIFFPGMWGADITNQAFARRLSPRFRVVGIDSRLGGDALAGDYDAERYFAGTLDAIRAALPARRLWLVGESFGGKLAVETARRLAGAGSHPEAVIVLDGEAGISRRRARMFAQASRPRPLKIRLAEGLNTHGGPLRLALHTVLGRLSGLADRRRDPRLQSRLAAIARRIGSAETRRVMERTAIGLVTARAFGDLPAGPLPMPLHLFITDDPHHDPARPDLGWAGRCERVVRAPIGGTHISMLRAPIVETVLERMAELEVVLRPAICVPRAIAP